MMMFLMTMFLIIIHIGLFYTIVYYYTNKKNMNGELKNTEIVYSVDQTEQILISKISENADSAFEYAEVLYNAKKEIPRQIIDSIIKKETWFSHSYNAFRCLCSFFKYKEHPQYIIDVISVDMEVSFKYANFLVELNREIPQIIIESVSRVSTYSLYVAICLHNKNKPIPKEFINSICRNHETSMKYAELLFNKDRKWISDNSVEDIISLKIDAVSDLF